MRERNEVSDILELFGIVAVVLWAAKISYRKGVIDERKRVRSI